MELREKIFSQHQSLWVICLTEDYLSKRLSPLPDLVDWYNNQIFSKSLIAGKVALDFGALTLIATSGMLPVSRVLYFGLGEAKSLGIAQSRKLGQDLSKAITDLGEKNPLILISGGVPEKFVEELNETRTRYDALAQAIIAVG